MGWQDAPVVDSKPAWMSAPEVGAKVEPSLSDTVAGLPITRFAMGVASPLIAAGQLGANIGDTIVAARGGTPVVGKYINEKLADYEAAKQRGMEGSGHPGMDVMGLLGSLAPSTAIANTVTKALPAATSLLGRMGVGATIGAAVSAAQPVTHGDQYFTDKARQTATGAVIGGATPPITDLATKITHGLKTIAEPLTERGRAAVLKRYQESLIGNNPDTKAKVIEALQYSQRQGPLAFVEGSQPTAGEAIAHIPAATGLASHQRAVSKIEGISPLFNARSVAQEAARRAAIGSIAQTPNALEEAVQARAAATTPMREQALAQANMKAPAVKAVPVDDGALKTAVELHAPAVSRPLKTSMEIAESQVGPLARDVTPLRASSLTKQIQGLASQPGTRVSDVASKSLQAIQDKIAGAANKKGLVDSRDLYMIRKEAGNIVQKYAEENKNFDQRMTAGLVKDVQGYIDDAIESAGGKGWKKYLTTYADMSKPINQMQVGQQLEKVLTSPSGATERGAMFSKAVQDAPQTLKTSTGSPRYRELSEVLTPEQTAKVKAVADELTRKDAYKVMAAKTNFSGAKAIHEGEQFPNLLSRPAMIANAILKHIAGNAGEKINQVAARQYLTPSVLAEALRDVPPSPQQQMIDAIMQRAGVPLQVGAAAFAARQY